MLNLRFVRLAALASVGLIPLHASAASTFVQWNFNSPTPDNNVNTGTDSPAINLLSSTLTQPTITRIGGVNGAINGDTSNPPFLYATGNSGGTNHSSDPAPTADNSAYTTAQYPDNTLPNVLATSETAGVQIATSTIGYQNITLTYDWLVQGSASEFWELQYSTDGTTFTDLQQIDAGENNTWQNQNTYALPAAAANQATLDIRIVSKIINGSGYSKNSSLAQLNYSGDNGQVRYDMVTLSGDAAPLLVPEPASLGLCAAGALALLTRRRAPR